MNYLLDIAASIPHYIPPIIVITVAFIAGIGVAHCIEFNLSILIIISICLALSGIGLALKSLKKFQRPLLCLLFLSAGYLRTVQIKNNYETIVTKINNKELTYEGYVDDILQLESHQFEYLITIKATRAYNTEKTIEFDHWVLCYTKQKPKVAIGDLIEISSLKIKKSKNDSYNSYCLKENILGITYYYTPAPFIVKKHSSNVITFLKNLRSNLFDRLKNKMSRTSFCFFSSFFLGNRLVDKKENEILKHECKYWGISHYLARSGLHLVVFILIWQSGLRFIPIPFIAKQCILLFLVFVYFALSWSSISFLRALLTFIFYKSYEFSRCLNHSLHVITLATFATLALNPYYLFFLDFQLSYSITFFLALISHLHTLEKRAQH